MKIITTKNNSSALLFSYHIFFFCITASSHQLHSIADVSQSALGRWWQCHW